jgi:hypothetical protein
MKLHLFSYNVYELNIEGEIHTLNHIYWGLIPPMDMGACDHYEMNLKPFLTTTKIVDFITYIHVVPL